MVGFSELDTHLGSTRGERSWLLRFLQGSELGSFLLGDRLQFGHSLPIRNSFLLGRSFVHGSSLHCSCSLLLGHSLHSRKKHNAFAKLGDFLGRELEEWRSCTSAV